MPSRPEIAKVEVERPLLGVRDASLSIEESVYSRQYDLNPFPFTHNLHELEFMCFDSLCELAAIYDRYPADYNLAGTAPSPDIFASASQGHRGLKPSSAVEKLQELPLRLLLKRPENHDERFRELMDALLKQIQQLPGGAHSQKIVRVQGSVLISSAAAITPLHFDPEIGFFCQIDGDKIYHIYSPDDLGEPELEDFYVRDQISTCRVDLDRRNPAREHVYHLKSGLGFHQPQNAPHWVQTCETRSISYTVVFETDVSRVACRARAFNYYQRKVGIAPSRPGLHPQRDALKARCAGPEQMARKAGKRMLRIMGR